MDDFKIIRGIGPHKEKFLHNAGIRTFTQLAKLSPEDLATLIPNLSASQIRKQDWVRQARKLASIKTKAKPRQKKLVALTTSQHYENFTLEFLLTEKNKLRRLRIMHVQSGEVETWANWNPEEVSYFLAQHTRARLIQTTPTPKTEEHKTITEIETGSQIPLQIFSPKPQTQSMPVVAINQIRLIKWTNSLSNSSQLVNSLPQDQNFDMKMILDLTKISLLGNTRLDVTGMVFAKKMGEGTRQLIGETQSIVPYAPSIDLTIGNASLTPGLYRLEAFVKLNPANSPSKSIDASFPGGLLQVY